MKKEKEVVSKWLVRGNKVVTVESKRLSDMIDQRMKEMLEEQDRKCLNMYSHRNTDGTE